MYQNVYLHKTTRGFERMLEAMWKRAKMLRDEGIDVMLVPAINEFWKADEPSVEQYLAIEEFTVLQQIQQWMEHDDKPLSDLARRFMNRDRFAMIPAPSSLNEMSDGYDDWEEALRREVEMAGYIPGDVYCLQDRLKGKYNQPYFPEKESDEQSAKTAIRILEDGASQPVEISQRLDRLKPIMTETQDRYRYYVPSEARKAAEKLRGKWFDE